MLHESQLRELAQLPDITREDLSFKELTTLHLGGRPQAVLRCSTPTAVIQAISVLDAHQIPLLVVGGGSNLVVADGEVPVVVVLIDAAQLEISDTGLVRAAAGAVWDDVVAATVERGLGGIECLSGIPGSAGATPVQNVGAYGTEVAAVLTQVRLWDRHNQTDSWVPASALELGYRYSNLKFTQRAVVLEIELQLSPGGLSIPLRFADNQQVPVAQAREMVLELRRSKGMVVDPADYDTWSAGSFFTNPVVSPAHAVALKEKHPTLPTYPAPDGVKLSAAWLIENAGFPKGYPHPSAPVGLSTKHTLALTNRGVGTTAELVELARELRAGVHASFQVTLEPEPVWVGVDIN
ncbi:UDP-N-acetylmuramate dehydrogenase [Corynebacterium caspium]|uniref:UDP-N-acetylmuramate dehydrogenase n=1 Tax=Corynebacterium caspium TaxID=234828 RepID=UPI0003816C2A|nr:UDP-N-acetylmuramate dehydrogenase [Corynebacterium caspium]WKD59924.1 UDP-N-acetylenolpyruvoylglucosamine reductase [Corynebacterium caspium DSM 44850]